jgi:two-component system OmpR family response regulator
VIQILVVEDDINLNRTVCKYLADSGFGTKGCLNVQDAYTAMYNDIYDIIVSDIMMPDVDGFEFAKTIRSINQKVPILFISALDNIHAKEKGFMLGIDDYMVKPIELNELILRIKALLRRANVEMERKISVGNLLLDADAMTAYINELEISITTREFNIMYKLLSYPNKTFSRTQLMNEFWKMESDTGLRAVDVYITKLRDKFSDCTGFKIVTVRGIGYKIVCNEKNSII